MALKPNDKPEFCADWWKSVQPPDISGKLLKQALETFEKMREEANKQAATATIEAAFSALKEVGKAVDKTISKECDKNKHGVVVTVLEKFHKAIKDEAKRLEEEKAKCEKDAKGAKSPQEDAAEDQDEKKIFTKEYLYKKIKKVKQGETFNFGLGLNLENPCESKLLLSVMFKPERLFKMLKAHKDDSGKLAFTDRCLSCGTVYRDPNNSKILVCKLGDGEKEPPRFFKSTRLMLRGDKKLLFKKTNLICGNTTIDDPEPLSAADGDDSETETGATSGATAELAQRLRSAAAAGEIWTKAGDDVTDQIGQLQSKLDMFDDAEAKAIRERLASLLDRYPKLDFAELAKSADQAAFDKSLVNTRAGLVQWARLVGSDPALRTIDKNPFVTTNVCGTYTDALRGIAAALKA